MYDCYYPWWECAGSWQGRAWGASLKSILAWFTRKELLISLWPCLPRCCQDAFGSIPKGARLPAARSPMCVKSGSACTKFWSNIVSKQGAWSRGVLWLGGVGPKHSQTSLHLLASSSLSACRTQPPPHSFYNQRRSISACHHCFISM